MAAPDINKLTINPAKANQRHNFFITDFFSNYEDVAQVPGLKKNNQSILSDAEQVLPSRYERFIVKIDQIIAKMGHVMKDFFGVNNPQHFTFLFLLGVLTSLAGFFVDYLSQLLISYKMSICDDQNINWFLRYFFWTLCAVIFSVIASALVTYWSREAEGTGICELKAIMSGLNIFRYFSFKTFTVKALGLIAALTAGFSIGKEGPFVHMSACIANKLAKLRWFTDIDRNQSSKKQMLAASVAAGMTSFFRAPMGGVLFSIEVASTYYMVSNLFKAFFCATCCIVMMELLQTYKSVQLFDKTQFPGVSTDHEVFFFALLGVLSGILGSLFVNVYYNLLILRDTIRAKFLKDRFQWSVTVGLIIGILCFPIPFLMLPDKTVVNTMFSSESLSSTQDIFNIWGKPSLVFNMVVFCMLKFFLIILAIASPIPAGVFTPTFTLGAVFGRLYGYALKNIGLALGVTLIKNEGIYAIIGAAALSGSVTRTTSVAMIVFELTGQTSLMVPILVGVLTSYAVSNSLSISVYDVMIEIKNYPFLPSLIGVATKNFTAKDFMNQNFLYLTKEAKLSDIAIIINKIGFQPVTIPVVESYHKKTLLFSVQAQSLRKYLIKYFDKVALKLDPEARQQLNQYFYALKQINIQPDKIDQEVIVDPLIHQQYPQLIGTVDYEQGIHKSPSKPKQKFLENLEAFWMNPVDFQDFNIQVDKAPFIVMEDTPMTKLHFIFIMLSISQVNVVKRGRISGIITKTEFMNQRKEKQQIEEVKVRKVSNDIREERKQSN